jgi:hypothetical protein
MPSCRWLVTVSQPYVQKYGAEMMRLELGTPETMAKSYSVPIRARPSRVRGF